jgi:hypothetical protein
MPAWVYLQLLWWWAIDANSFRGATAHGQEFGVMFGSAQMSKQTLILLIGAVLTVSACATTSDSILRTGTFQTPMTLTANDPEVAVAGIMAGEGWTNIWVDVLVKAKAADRHVDPGQFSLFIPATGITVPASQRRVPDANCGGVPNPGFRARFCSGTRSPDFQSGTRDPSTALDIKAGQKMTMTLLFETGQGKAEELEDLELVFGGQRVHLGAAEGAKEREAREAREASEAARF